MRDPVSRARNIDKIYNRMGEIALTRTTAEWEELLLRHRRPAHRLRQADRGRRAAASEGRRHVRRPRSPDRGEDPSGPPDSQIFREPGRQFAAWRRASASTRARSCKRPATPMQTLPRSSSARQQELVELVVGCLCATVHSTAVAKPQMYDRAVLRPGALLDVWRLPHVI